LAALSVELIAPTAFALVDPAADEHSRSPFFAMVIGCVIGGLVYVGLSTLAGFLGAVLFKLLE
jgi:hypothetical protein